MGGSAQRTVAVFGLGGTIAMAGSAHGGVTPSLSAHDLVAAVPGLADTGIAVDVVDFRRLPSASLDFATLDELSAAIDERLDRGATGVVVVQGTDTIEETAYLLDLRHRRDAPLIVTGAMRNPTMAGADGPANLLAAVVTAADPRARNRGVLVVFNDEIHTAHQVRKTHTTALDTFRSPDAGPAGWVVEGRVRFVGPPPPRLTVPAPASGTYPRVGVYPVVLDDDPAVLAAMIAAVDGLVVAAMGAGHVPAALVEPLTKAAARMPVILTSRTGAGSVLRDTYGFAGSERDLIAHGLDPAGRLDPLKARVLLRCLLAAQASRDQIRTAFAVAGGYRDADDWPWPIDDRSAAPGPD
jgi:L-asparaginase/archaeal Glu-tRNAGln amidotransferase subunit D